MFRWVSKDVDSLKRWTEQNGHVTETSIGVVMMKKLMYEEVSIKIRNRMFMIIVCGKGSKCI